MSSSSTSHITVCDGSPPGCSQSLFSLRLSPLMSVLCQCAFLEGTRNDITWCQWPLPCNGSKERHFYLICFFYRELRCACILLRCDEGLPKEHVQTTWLLVKMKTLGPITGTTSLLGYTQPYLPPLLIQVQRYKWSPLSICGMQRPLLPKEYHR